MKWITCDTETTGLSTFHGARPFLYIIGLNATQAKITENVENIREIMEDQNIVKVFHNAKFDMHMLRSVGVEVKGHVFDTMIAAKLLNENESASLDNCSKMYLSKEDGKKTDLIEEWFKKKKIKKADRRYDKVPKEILYPYAEADAIATYKLFKIFVPKLKEQGLWELYLRECSLIRVILDMETIGTLIDVPYFEKLSKEYKELIKRAEEDIYSLVGYEFDIASNKQLTNALLESGIELPKTAKDNYSSSEEVLNSIDHPITNRLKDYRKATKYQSTYIDSFLDKHVDGVMHPSFNQIGTVTGRFSSSAPNYQNIMSEDKLIKRGIIPREGYYLVCIDYKQQEYRVFLDYANEEELIAKVNKEGLDFHQMIADQLGLTRTEAKTINFGLLYGMGAKTLAESLGIDYYDAVQIRKDYFNKLPNAKKLFDEVESAVVLRGYIRNKFDRIRRLKGDEAYKAINALIQGTCADFVKVKMLECHNMLKKFNSALVLQVHDELVFEVRKDEMGLIPRLVEIMEDCTEWFNIKLDVDVELSDKSWGDKQPW